MNYSQEYLIKLQEIKNALKKISAIFDGDFDGNIDLSTKIDKLDVNTDELESVLKDISVKTTSINEKIYDFISSNSEITANQKDEINQLKELNDIYNDIKSTLVDIISNQTKLQTSLDSDMRDLLSELKLARVGKDRLHLTRERDRSAGSLAVFKFRITNNKDKTSPVYWDFSDNNIFVTLTEEGGTELKVTIDEEGYVCLNGWQYATSKKGTYYLSVYLGERKYSEELIMTSNKVII